jgi:hypothetical protein
MTESASYEDADNSGASVVGGDREPEISATASYDRYFVPSYTCT